MSIASECKQSDETQQQLNEIIYFESLWKISFKNRLFKSWTVNCKFESGFFLKILFWEREREKHNAIFEFLAIRAI